MLLRGAAQPIAIVGMSCRYPGGVRSAEDLWQLVARGVDAISEFPVDRGWDLERLYDPDPDHQGTSYARYGGFLDDAGGFDAEHFSISPREALATDPQQRLLLEGTWEALENAGIDPLSVRGSHTGVFAGLARSNYGSGAYQSQELEGFHLTGSTASVASGRVAYTFGLEGPAVSVDTACSSSLVAIHLACQALRQGECELALAGGVTVLSTPELFVAFSRQRGMSVDGRCKSFGAGADGTGWSEGIGLVVLERLSDAQRNGHRVLAVVRGGAVNQDGASNGLTAPNGPSQERVITQALESAGLSFSDVDAVEAHGTGTMLGDPIEAQALLATYGQGRVSGPLYLGSVKSNIGHAQAAAGVAGVIKMVKAFEHDCLPRTLHAQEPSPHVDWSMGEVKLLDESVSWPAAERVRRVGVSSFGVSGTNAHLILEQAPESVRVAVAGEQINVGPSIWPFVVSGKSSDVVRSQAERLRAHLVAHPELELGDIALTLALHRASLTHRAVVLAQGREQLVERLDGLAGGVRVDGVLEGGAGSGGGVAFLFSGQGSQRPGMGRELYRSFPVFAGALDELCGELDPHVGRSMKDLLFAEKGSRDAALLDRTEFTQPALFALEVALYRLLRSMGVKPDYLIGHSVGELSAAHVAGVLGIEDAARLVVARGRLMGALPDGGAMLALRGNEEEVVDSLQDFDGRLSIAAVNAPNALVVSGERGAIEELQARWQDQGRKGTPLRVSHAFHSALMQPMLAELQIVAEELEFAEPELPIVSNVSGRLLSVDQATAPAYWVSHVRETVRFADGVRFLKDAGVTRFLEIGPDGALGALASECLEEELGEGASFAASLRARKPELEAFMGCLAEAHAHGLGVDWSVFFADRGGRPVELPTYAFQQTRYWLSAGAGDGDARSLGQSAAEHPFLGAVVHLAGEDAGWLFTGRLSLREDPWLKDHGLMDIVLLPGTAFLELALAAAQRVGAETVEELTLHAPLILQDEQHAVQIQLTVSDPDDRQRREITIHSRPEGSLETVAESEQWTLHATGALSPQEIPPDAGFESFAAEAWPPAGADSVDVGLLYGRLADAGYHYGPAFQGLRAAWRRGAELFAEVTLEKTQASQTSGFHVHPALSDSALHTLILRGLDAQQTRAPEVPFSLSGVSLHGDGATTLRVRICTADSQGVQTLSLLALDPSGTPVLSIQELRTRPIDSSALTATTRRDDDLYELQWTRLAAQPAHGSPPRLALLDDDIDLPMIELQRFTDLGALEDAITQGANPPELVLVRAGVLAEGSDAQRENGQLTQRVHAVTGAALGLLQGFIALECFEGRLVLLTEGALAVTDGESPDLVQAGLVGLLRSAHSEHPGRFSLIDVDGSEVSWGSLQAALVSDEPELAIREGSLFVPRLAGLGSCGSLVPPVGSGSWHLSSGSSGTLEGLLLRESSQAGEPLGEGQVRIAVHAAGLNFRDVLIALGAYPGVAALGGEGAGVVLEVAEDVSALAVGDRVMGLIPDAFGPVAVSDAQLLVKVPEGWSFREAASVPMVFLTAYYGLVDLAGLRRGEALLLHGAAGGVGMAALQLAAHIGAEVFATAHPEKWGTLEGLGIDAAHIASSRDLQFKEKFLAVSGDRGVDVVLDSLAGEFVDASLELLPRGGRFIEMGKADIRDPDQVSAKHAGVSYRAFDLAEVGAERIQEMLVEILGLFERGVLRPLPVSTWDVRRGPEAFRFLMESRHVGKIVLEVPQPPDPDGTVLITGATGGLGGLVARHFAIEHGARHLLLLSRSGLRAEGAAELRRELEDQGVEVQIVACDVAERSQLARVIAAIPSEHPLTTVIHAAGVLDDGVITSLDSERLSRVMAPKVDGAINLHELTEHLDLSAFILFSSAVASLGSPGQGNYAAANALLDALAHYRRARGLPCISLAWGVWEKTTGMTSEFTETDRSRWARAGISPLSDEQGVQLLDIASSIDEPLLLPVRLDIAALRARARAGVLPPLMSGLIRASIRRADTEGSLARRLAAAPESDRNTIVLELVTEHVAGVLGHASAEAIDVTRDFKELGFDSLGAVELRNRLRQATGLKLPSSLIFDYPTPAAVAEHLRAKVKGTEHDSPVSLRSPARADEPIAIVGMSCRYPGGVCSPEELWDLVASGTDAIGSFPEDRGWDLERLFDPDPDRSGTSYVRNGGFLHDAAQFDPAFFSISPREALAMDPQQRLLLEGAWEAFEAAGIDPSSLRGSPTGVFAGVISSEYGFSENQPETLQSFRLTGSTASVASGRLAYTFGLEGPAVSVDTACSSSLVAIHLACQALRAGECELALAGGVTVLATPGVLIAFSSQRVLSPDGRCKAFGANADGIGWAEGVGLVVLERLSHARRNGHRVLAVVTGSSVNQDGASNGLTAPNGPSQQRVIARALANAGLSPEDIDAVEAHGTGTTLGDPIEAQALLASYGHKRAGKPLWLGSLKSNIGHTQAAAGVAGVIKMVKALEHDVLPRTLHAEEPSPHIDWSEGGVSLLSEPVPWLRSERIRRAGVSSFGISGTNAHLIVEQAPVPERSPEFEQNFSPDAARAAGQLHTEQQTLPFLLSAKTTDALRSQAKRLRSYLAAHQEIPPARVASTLALHRACLEHRAVAIAAAGDGLADSLLALEQGEPGVGLLQGAARRHGRLAFVFSGNGGQWDGMALELWESSPLFAEQMRACSEALGAYCDWSLEAVLRGSAGAPSLERVDVAQPALFAVMVSLAALWRSFGVKPSAVVGHSQGEVTAAHVAGALSLDDAARIVALRSKALTDELSGHGGMAFVPLPAVQVAKQMEPFGERLSLAAVNGPSAVVVTGESEALEQLMALYKDMGIRAKTLPADGAGHSTQVETIRDRLIEELSPIRPCASAIPFYSTTTGAYLDTTELTAEYWYRNARHTVQFERVIHTLIADSFTAFVEVGPHPVLTTAVQETIDAEVEDADALAVIGSLRRGEGNMTRFLNSLSEAHIHGLAVDWSSLFADGEDPVELPTYAFQREHYWLSASGGTGDARTLGQSVTDHPLLGATLHLAGEDDGLILTGRLALQSHPWIGDHAINDTVLLPDSTFIELALAAAELTGAGAIEELTFEQPLVLEGEAAYQLQLKISSPDASRAHRIAIYARAESSAKDQLELGPWTRHATGALAPIDDGAPSDNQPVSDLTSLAKRSWSFEEAEELEVELLYDRFAEAGYDYGAAFQGLRRAWRTGDELYAEIALADEEAQEAPGFCLHPALLDAALQTLAFGVSQSEQADELEIASSLSGVRLHARGASLLRVCLRMDAGGAASLLALDSSGAPVLSIDSLIRRPIDQSQLELAAPKGHDTLYGLLWGELSAQSPDGSALAVTLIGDGEGLRNTPIELQRYPDLESLQETIEAGGSPPELVLVETWALAADGGRETREEDTEQASADVEDGQLTAGIHAITARTLELLQVFLANESLAQARLVLLTEGALAVTDGESPDLVQAGLVGLLRSAHSEHPGRFSLIDVDGSEVSWGSLQAALVSDEPELAIREGSLFVPRLAGLGSCGSLVPPVGSGSWHLSSGSSGTLEGLLLRESSQAGEPLGEGQVRIAVHAAGLNFRDVLIALGAYPGVAALGGEGAGVVLEVAEDVSALAVGDRVMGLIPDAFGPVAVSDAQLLVKVPEGWSFREAASVPMVFLTAYYGLVDLAGLRRGEALLLHGAAGGVGMAALQLAAHIGAEVFATAHPEKWGTLEGLGIDAAHIASSRDLQFKEKFLAVSGDRGVDVVLDSLAGEFVDASLELLPRGGRFIEMGKADIRDPDQVSAKHAGVSYRAFDLAEVGAERIQEMLVEILGLFERGVLRPLPVSTWDVRRGPEAFRFLMESRHVGKIVLEVPQPPDPDGTVLITGATGGLGGLVARHFAIEHGARHLLLLSRSGLRAEGAAELRRELEDQGVEVQIVACDVAERSQLARVIAAIPSEHPLTTVIHAAGVLDDGVITSLDSERLSRVMAPKVDGAINLHELTEHLDLSAFILFSSAVASLGSPGQGNYAAANALLDALAHYRRARGLPCISLAWGVWEKTTGMTSEFTETDRSRWARAGISPLSDEQGVQLLDIASSIDEPLLLPVRLDIAALRARARAGVLPPLMSGLIRASIRRADTEGSLARRLAAAPESDRNTIAVKLVREHVASLMGHASAEAVDANRSFKELGFDSLGAVELRNRLSRATGLKLPATLVFDHPTPAAVAEHLRSRIEGQEHGAQAITRRSPARADEPIAIVGMSCRYPGGVCSPEELWNLVASGEDAIGEFPTNRGWEIGRIYDPNPDHRGTIYTRGGGFLHDAGDFDAAHFSISPREALAMDPQQRLLLEGAWEAFEVAGLDPLSLRGSETGVFAGVIPSDYGVDLRHLDELEDYLTGGAGSVVSGRLSYSFGLEGPAISVDTGCSSSLVAIHLACQALRQGECELALAGGVMVVATPTGLISFSRQRGFSPDGRCKSFGAGADGMGCGEGVGLLLLERLSEARVKGHQVLALVRGSAVNQDGASNGLTAPNGPSQERVIRQALACAALSASDIDAVEAHGTGTTLGDPIEAQALISTYGQGRSNGPLHLGSLKSNIGHPQAAAGVAGVIKMVKALEHQMLPRTLHVEEPSPHIDWSEGEVSLLGESVPWPVSERVRRAGVSSFGISGTNVHLILEEAPRAAPTADVEQAAADAPSSSKPEFMPFLISGSTERALRAQAALLHSHLRSRPQLEPYAVATSLALGRAQLPHRAVVVAREHKDLSSSLLALQRGVPVDGLVEGVARSGGRVAFLFSGQGGQWDGMALELWESLPVFAEQMQACATALGAYCDWSLEDVLRAEQGAPGLERVDVVQPALFAVMVSLAAVWRSFGVVPSAVVGHSQGEIAAAHVAGALSLEDAARVVALRSKALGEELAGRGGMVSVSLSARQIETLIEPFGERLALAAVNGPSSVVVSGEPDALQELLALCASDGIRAKQIPVDYASHSAQIEMIRDRLLEELAPIDPRPCEIPFCSTTTGTVLDTAKLTGEYWYRNLRHTVQFERATRTLVDDAFTTFIEMGPHPVLTMAVQETIETHAKNPDAVAVIGSLRRNDGGIERLLGSLSEAYVHGVGVDWSVFFADQAAHRVELPTYAFQRERYWLTASAGAGDPRSLGLDEAAHPFLGAAVQLAGEGQGWLFTGRLSLQEHPWLGDHAAWDSVILPGSALLELALAAAQQVGEETVAELTLHTPLLLDEEQAVQIQLTISERDNQLRRQIDIHSRPATPSEGISQQQWTLHASGVIDAGANPLAPTLGGFVGGVWPPVGADLVDVEFLYDRLAEAGYQYGPVFQGVRAAWRCGQEFFVEVALDEAEVGQVNGFAVHPALFDAALHALVLPGLDVGRAGELLVPFSFSGVRLLGRGGSSLRVCVRVGGGRGVEEGVGVLSLLVLDAGGVPVLSIEELRMRAIDRGALGVARGGREDLYELEWVELQRSSSNGVVVRAAVLGDATDESGAALERYPEGIELERFADLGALEDAIAGGALAPELVLVDVGRLGELAGVEGDGLAARVRALTAGALGLLQGWLASEFLQDARLVFVTERGVAVVGGESPDLVQAALVGLVRSAHTEHPGRFYLVDSDGGLASLAVLRLLLSGGDEPELALREGSLYAPRLARVKLEDRDRVFALDSEGTVLITGATGGLGALVARHLVSEHGVRHLLLLSRRGLEAAPAGELQQELRQLGAQVRIVACDVADREQLAGVLAAIPAEHALSSVIHAAGVLEDGVIEALDSEHLARVMAPKVDAAINLHELAAGVRLIFFSSAAGTMGGPGQANYAAANAFLDALAHHRRAEGLPAISLAWGAWENATGMTGSLSESDRSRLGRLGVVALSDAQGLELFDIAGVADRPTLVPMRLDASALRAQASAGMLPAMMRSLIRSPLRRNSTAQHTLATRLAATPESEWPTITLGLVKEHVAVVLGHDTPNTIEPNRPFKELGFDSVGAIRLRNHLTRAAGLQLPTTLVFDYPTPSAVAEHLRSLVEGREADRSTALVLDAGDAPALDAEALPDSEIWAPTAAGRARRAHAAPLLTGATGFLGAHLLRELLERVDGPIRCLVRASDTDDALTRLRAAQQTYLTWDEGLEDRIIPVLGDLAQPLFGCAPEEFAQLASTTDAIFHAGATGNHVYPYAQLKSVNVDATRDLLRLACAAQPIPLHYVSTLGTLAPRAAARGVQVTEESFVLSADIPANGYLQSKWVADRMVTNARSRGLTTTVYRPGFILGHSETGACNIKDTIWRMLRVCILLEAVPAGVREWFAAPVDFVSGAIADLALSPASVNRAYHLISPVPFNDTALYQLVRDFGYPLEELPASEWRSRLTSLTNRADDPDVEATVALIELQDRLRAEGPEALDRRSDGIGGHVSYECEGAARDLRHTPLPDDTALAQSVRASLRYLTDTGYLAGPPARREPVSR